MSRADGGDLNQTTLLYYKTLGMNADKEAEKASRRSNLIRILVDFNHAISLSPSTMFSGLEGYHRGPEPLNCPQLP
jgi:hypothetical protein